MLPIRIAKNPIIGDKNEFEDHRYWAQCPAFDVMCWVLYWAWTAKKSDVVEFCHTLVCRADGEPSLHPKESKENIPQGDIRPNRIESFHLIIVGIR